MRRSALRLVPLLIAVLVGARSAAPDDFGPLFNGSDLSGWVNVIGAENAWTVRGESIRTAGAPSGILRTDRPYENYILELEYRTSTSSNRVGLVVHSDALPAVGQPWPRGINIQLQGADGRPIIAPVAGAMIESVPEEDEQMSNTVSSDEWIDCRIESRDGRLTVAVGGEVVATANYASPRKGYIALKSDGADVRFRNIRLRELPSTQPAPYEVAEADRGFRSLYNGSDLSTHWEMKPGHRGHWTARDWFIDYDGSSEADDKSLWTREEYEDFMLIADMRFTREPAPDSVPVVLPDGSDATNPDGSEKLVEIPYAGDSGIYVRGSSKNQINMGNRYIGSGEIYGYRVDDDMPAEVRRAVVPRVKADHPPGEWNRYVITMREDRITVELNGHVVVDRARLPGISARGKIALQDDHASGNRFQFGNIYIKQLD